MHVRVSTAHPPCLLPALLPMDKSAFDVEHLCTVFETRRLIGPLADAKHSRSRSSADQITPGTKYHVIHHPFPHWTSRRIASYLLSSDNPPPPQGRKGNVHDRDAVVPEIGVAAGSVVGQDELEDVGSLGLEPIGRERIAARKLTVSRDSTWSGRGGCWA